MYFMNMLIFDSPQSLCFQSDIAEWPRVLHVQAARARESSLGTQLFPRTAEDITLPHSTYLI